MAEFVNENMFIKIISKIKMKFFIKYVKIIKFKKFFI